MGGGAVRLRTTASVRRPVADLYFRTRVPNCDLDLQLYLPSPSGVRTESATVPRTVSTASRVRSSESGQRCEYTSSVCAADECPRRACTVLTDSPCRMSRAPAGRGAGGGSTRESHAGGPPTWA